VKTGLTGCLYQSDRPTDAGAGQAHLRPTHEHVLWCMTRSRANTLFDDSTGDKEAFIGYYGLMAKVIYPILILGTSS
jgi:hypothetical protein